MSEVRPGGGDPRLGSLLGGRYRLLDVIGSGGAGRVYRAIQEPMGREVAVKVLHSHLDADGEHDFQSRFLREAALAGRLQHPNVVTVHDYGRTDAGDCYLVMEHLRGRTLRSVLRDGALPLPRALRVFEQLVRGLRAAHRRGMVHRDVKPSNIILLRDEDGLDRVKLFDFGLVKAEDEDSSVTVAGTFMGTPQYVSPEQAEGRDADARSDLYSAAVVLYRMITGVLPYTGESPLAVAIKHSREPYPPMAERMPGIAVPPVVEDLVADLMAKAPGDRPADADVVLERLVAIQAMLGFDGERTVLPEDAPSLSALGSVARVPDDALERVPTDEVDLEPTVTVEPAPGGGGRVKVAAALGVGLLVAGAGGAGGLWWLGGRGGEEPDAASPVEVVEASGGALALVEEEAPPVPPPPREVTLFISSEPGGAQVWLDEALLGETPMVQRIVVPADEPAPSRHVELRLDGYRSGGLDLDLSEADATGHLVLDALPRRASASGGASSGSTSSGTASSGTASSAGASPSPGTVVADGVYFSSAQAAAALALVNDGDADALRATGITGKQLTTLMDGRPFANLGAVAATPWIGEKTMEKLKAAVE
ncbi:MAG: serine/threonine protein kinase [Alphaproteobacteria bacterium]|nr:serine/threonine protein kinase [Alphaproteobacteria bacterium]